MRKRGLARAWVLALVFAYLSTGLVHHAPAAMIGTQAAVAAQERDARIASVQTSMARQDVLAQMISMGVDPEQASQRVTALTNDELALLESEFDHLPAGAGVLEVIGIVFVVLLILEITGVTDIFKKI